MLSVQTNMLAANASRNLGLTTKANTKSAEKSSSGYRINRAADDAAGLSISEKMRRQVRGLTQAAANAQDGTSPRESGYVEMKSYDIVYDLRDGSLTVNEAQAGPGTTGAARADSAVKVSSGSKLADMIANDIVPNAVKQILDTFDPLKTAVGNDTIKMSLEVAYIDGKNQILAYASFRYGSSGKPVSMGIRVDSADFNESDANGSGKRAAALPPGGMTPCPTTRSI